MHTHDGDGSELKRRDKRVINGEERGCNFENFAWMNDDVKEGFFRLIVNMETAITNLQNEMAAMRLLIAEGVLPPPPSDTMLDASEILPDNQAGSYKSETPEIPSVEIWDVDPTTNTIRHVYNGSNPTWWWIALLDPRRMNGVLSQFVKKNLLELPRMACLTPFVLNQRTFKLDSTDIAEYTELAKMYTWHKSIPNIKFEASEVSELRRLCAGDGNAIDISDNFIGVAKAASASTAMNPDVGFWFLPDEYLFNTTTAVSTPTDKFLPVVPIADSQIAPFGKWKPPKDAENVIYLLRLPFS